MREHPCHTEWKTINAKDQSRTDGRNPEDFTDAALAKPFTIAQRERMFRNRPSNVGNDISLADWHRVVQYVEACHGIKPEEQSND